MCTIVEGGCGCGGSKSGMFDSAKAAVGVVVVLAAVSVAYQVAEQAWPLLLTGYLMLALLGFPRSRRVVLRLVRMMWRAVRRRRRPSTALAVAVPYQAELYRRDGERLELLLKGPVPGVWSSPAQVEGVIIQRWVDTQGTPAAELVCEATPLAGRIVGRRA